MSDRPWYVVHRVDEKDVTVDWLYGPGRYLTKVTQVLLIVIGWFFVVLPIVITASSILNRGDPRRGWWGYHEGFVMWDITIVFLVILLCFFVIVFLILAVADRMGAPQRQRSRTFDADRLALRLELADAWYAEKFGPEALRRQRKRIEIEPYADIETYELRGRYHSNGIG